MGTHISRARYEADVELKTAFEAAGKFFGTIEANIEAKRSGRDADRTLHASEVIGLHAHHESFSVDVGFFFLANDGPRLLVIKRAPIAAPPRRDYEDSDERPKGGRGRFIPALSGRDFGLGQG